MSRELKTTERQALSVGSRATPDRPDLPEYVTVIRAANRFEYEALSDASRCWVRGNEMQVHNWLARHNYKRVQFTPGSWVLGTFKRPKEVSNEEASTVRPQSSPAVGTTHRAGTPSHRTVRPSHRAGAAGAERRTREGAGRRPA